MIFTKAFNILTFILLKDLTPAIYGGYFFAVIVISVINLMAYGWANRNIASKIGFNLNSGFWLGLLGPLGMSLLLFRTNPSAKDFVFGVLRFIAVVFIHQLIVEAGMLSNQNSAGVAYLVGFPWVLRGKSIFHFEVVNKKDSSVTKTSDPAAAPTPVNKNSTSEENKLTKALKWIDENTEPPVKTKKESTETKDNNFESWKKLKMAKNISFKYFSEEKLKELYEQENPNEKKEELPIQKIVESKSEESVEKAENKLDNSASESKPRVSSTKPNFCGDCGASLASAKNFCTNCGNKL
jgi:hypothetical protein